MGDVLSDSIYDFVPDAKNTRSYKNYTAKWTNQEPMNITRIPHYSNDFDEDEQYIVEMLKVDFYKDNEFIYTLYKVEHHDYDIGLALEWFEMNNGKTVHLFNFEPGLIYVIDADTGQELHHSKPNSSYMVEYQMFEHREYLYLFGHCPHGSGPRRFIFHIPTFLTTPDYNPMYIAAHVQYEGIGGIELAGNISLYGCASVKEFLERKDEILAGYAITASTAFFNANRNSEILLQLFVKDPNVKFMNEAAEAAEVQTLELCLLQLRICPDMRKLILKYARVSYALEARKALQNVLDTTQERFHIETWGNCSGLRLFRYDRCFYNEIKYSSKPDDPYAGPLQTDSLTFLAPKMFIPPNFISNLPMEQYNLRFEMYATKHHFTIYYYQPLTWNGKDPLEHDPSGTKRCDVDVDKPCKITIKLCKN